MFNYESPVFVSVVLYTIYALLLLAAGTTLWSAASSLRHRAKGSADALHLPAGRTVLCTAVGTVLLLAATWLTASTKPLVVNGKPYADIFWLRTSGMLITTAAVLMAAAVAAIAVAAIRERLSR